MNETILSGDLKQNDGANFTNYCDNAYHVVIQLRDGDSYLNGLVVRGGYSNKNSYDDGAGIQVESNNGLIVIDKCVVRNDLSYYRGAGIDVTHTNVVGKPSLLLLNSFVLNNSAARFAALSVNSSVEVVNTVFGNYASSFFSIIDASQRSLPGSFSIAHLSTKQPPQYSTFLAPDLFAIVLQQVIFLLMLVQPSPTA